MNTHSRQIAVLLVFLPIFATVAPATVAGEDTVYVQNIAVTSNQTGGQGVDGVNGTDGKDGEDGKPGQSGTSVSSGEGRSTAKVITATNGNTTEVHSDVTGMGEVYTNIVTSTEPTLEEGQESATAEPGAGLKTESSDEQRSKLLSLLSTLQKLIEHYVNALF